MHTLSSFELLDVWERGRTQRQEHRALQALAAAWPETSIEALAELDLGHRDARLLALREATFGSRLSSVTACPACGERLELTFDVADILVEDLSGPPPVSDEPHVLEMEDWVVQFRVPNSRDLEVVGEAASAAGSAEAARRTILARCILEARQKGQNVDIEQLPEVVMDAVAASIGEADPQANIDLDLTCPACGERWLGAFDIASFFWTEIEVWAQRLLTDVHRLASAYGWREADILAMTPLRRRTYLEMISYG
jgi:uncharacterized protein (UPF0212 family)